MKSNDLRIGNYVTYNPEAVDEGTLITPLLVTAIDDDAGVILNDGFQNVYDFDEILPIPLTPELLQAAGFSKAGDWDYELQRLCLHDMLSGRDKDWEVYLKAGNDAVYVTNIKYLHQLQNLYYSLTGTELELKQLIGYENRSRKAN